jgi:hypothetical protein
MSTATKWALVPTQFCLCHPYNRVKNADLTVYLINLVIWQFGPHGYFVQEVDSVELNF